MDDWITVRERAEREFGSSPHGELEQEVIDSFNQNPISTTKVIDSVIHDLRRGSAIHSPWAVVRSRLHTALPDSEVTSDRERRVRLASNWIKNAGVYCDQPEQVLDELFSATGLLHDWKADSNLQSEMVSLWLKLRPFGEKAEQQAEEYQRGFATNETHQRRFGKREKLEKLGLIRPQQPLPSAEDGVSAPAAS